jgi:mycothiol synthase
MIRHELLSLPQVSLPAGFSARCFRKGDEAAWEAIIGDSFGSTFHFQETMKNDPGFRPERIWFACEGDTPIATASAWVRPEYGESFGYLHMVGILSSHAGKGIGQQATLLALHQMAAEGRTASVLHTDDFRLPAIRIYSKLGYIPNIEHENHPMRWRAIAERNGWPELLRE